MARPGKLDQRITFQSFATASDGMGGQSRTWANLASIPTVWAAVQLVRGNETFSEDRTNATGLYLFTIRNRSDLDERGRIVWNGENYDIRAIKRAGTREMYLKIEAERGT